MSDQLLEKGRLPEEIVWRQGIFESAIRMSVAGAVALMVLFSALGILGATIPTWPIVGAAAVTGVFSLLSLLVARRVSFQPAVILYIAGVTLTTFVSIYFAGGVTGPVLLLLMVLPVLTGQLGGVLALRWGTTVVMLLWLVSMLLEILGVVTPARLAENTVRFLYYTIFPVALLLTAIIVRIFVQRGQYSMGVVYEREQSLSESMQQAQAAAVAEREARERETRAALHVRETVAGYADYLSRVAAGEYTARVDVGELDEDVEGDHELHALGEYLNTTVDTLVAALTQAQEVQRRYAEQTWQAVVKSGRAQPGFAYRENQITPEAEWLPQMIRAVSSEAMVAEGDGAAMPLVINRQVVGAIGGQHPDGRPWTDEELSLIEDVTGQLAQTIESLRLFDETQRRATQERLVSEVTGRIRETLDVESVLKTAAREIGEALGFLALDVRLDTEKQT